MALRLIYQLLSVLLDWMVLKGQVGPAQEIEVLVRTSKAVPDEARQCRG